MDIKLGNLILTLYKIKGARNSEKISGLSYTENINLCNKLNRIDKPLISQNEKIFLLTTDSFTYIFANLEDIKEIVIKYNIVSFKMFWNGKFNRISKKTLNEMLKVNGIDFKLK